MSANWQRNPNLCYKQLMRTFIAIDLPEEAKDDIAAVARQLSAVVKGRFLQRDTYHLTVAFLGETSEPEVARAMDALDAACSATPELPLRFTGLGTFGKPHDATLWLGLENTLELEKLVASIRTHLTEEGITYDSKPFKPHVTIARRAALPRGPLPSLAFPLPANARSITLYKSTLSREGATYKPLYTLELPKEDPAP